MNILWLTPRNWSATQQEILSYFLRAKPVRIDPASDIFFASMHQRVLGPIWVKKKGTKATWICNEDLREAFFAALEEMLATVKPKLLVVADQAALSFLTGYTSLEKCRGSVYYYRNLPVIVVDDLLKTQYGKRQTESVDASGKKVKSFKHYPWVYLNDLQKIKRWMIGAKRNEPRFSYHVVRRAADLSRLLGGHVNWIACSVDIETIGTLVDCVGFTFVDRSGAVGSVVVPFVNSQKPGNLHWASEEEEIAAWEMIRKVLASDCWKIMQGGSYDCAYFLKYRIPVKNYLFDTGQMMHSIWAESPKRLHFLASLFVDHVRYWKDERKGEEDEKFPTTREGMERRWRYNALDCHNTLLCCFYLLRLLNHPNFAWAARNYNTELRAQLGPALSMSMTGAWLNEERQQRKKIHWLTESEEALRVLRIMCDDEEFNPSSPYQCASLIYDVLGAHPIKMRGKNKLGARSVDEKVLKLIRVQHPLFARFIDQIWAVKKPLNNAAKYGGGLGLNGRFLYRYSPDTETLRYTGKQHSFWVGTNPQNIPLQVRDMIQADKGYILWEADYSQSDLWFVAASSGVEKLRQVLLSGVDTHALHASEFFKIPYEKIVEGHAKGEDWVDHPTEGVRQNTKRIVHGGNYQMAGFTLYVIMGHEAVIATAKALGQKDAHNWPREKLIALCERLIQFYLHKLYPGLPDWFESSAQECARNGNLATCFGGFTRHFFGNILANPAVARELSAFYGQGGTAGNLNRALDEIYWRSSLADEGLMLLFQTHDSIAGQVEMGKLDLLENVLTIMEKECIFNGWKFTVPVEIKVGLSWGKGMMKWKRGMSVEEIVANETQWEARSYAQLAAQ